MSDKATKQKLDIWRQKLVDLERELRKVMQRRGEAAAMGDLRENAAYQMLTEQAEVLSARMADIQKMIQELEKDDKKKE